jgi:hypothetical protein
MINQLELVRSVTTEPNASRLVDRESDPRAPAQSIYVAPDCLDMDVGGDARHAQELVFHARCLECSLRLQRDVLEVTTTTTIRSSEWARWRHPVR